jgi:hypothetical protein
MNWLLLLSVFLHISVINAFPDFAKRSNSQLLPRAASDPCCKSCAPIAKVEADCPLATTDIFCGCDEWVAAAPTCEACIANVAFNTTFAVQPGPLLEVFWAFCQCKKECRKVAEANFGPEPCKNGTDELCVVKTLVEDGPECLCCLEKVDEWFASYFGIFVKQAKDFLVTQVSAVPGTPSEY